jgi:hypothetical protein
MKCIYSKNTGTLIAWWDETLMGAYSTIVSSGVGIAVIDIPENIEKEIRMGKTEYKVTNGKLVKYDNI